jgi:hypothetical protein
MPAISKVPAALRHHHYGGLNTAAECRKENFVVAGPRFLIGLGYQIGVNGYVETERGLKTESGTARLVADRLVLELSEPPERTGLQLKYFVCDADTHLPVSVVAQEPVESLAPEGAIDDFVWRMKRMLSGAPAAVAGGSPAAKNQSDLFI